MFNVLQPWHLIIIVGLLVVLFGAKRLPGSARSLAQSMRIFRTEMSPEHDAERSTPDVPQAVPPAPQPVATSQTGPVSAEAVPGGRP